MIHILFYTEYDTYSIYMCSIEQVSQDKNVIKTRY